MDYGSAGLSGFGDASSSATVEGKAVKSLAAVQRAMEYIYI